MQKGMIITLPDYDDATSYLSYFSKFIIEEAEQKNFKIKIIDSSELNAGSFSQIVRKLDYNFIMINGHGSEDSIFGYKSNILIKADGNADILKEKVTYARSCNAGSILGENCVKNSKKGCFIGYTLPFIFYIDNRWSTKPNNDNIAKLFLLPSNAIAISLIKGNVTLEAHENSKKQILKNIKRLLENKGTDSYRFAEAPWNNYIGQVILGDVSATL